MMIKSFVHFFFKNVLFGGLLSVNLFWVCLLVYDMYVALFTNQYDFLWGCETCGRSYASAEIYAAQECVHIVLLCFLISFSIWMRRQKRYVLSDFMLFPYILYGLQALLISV